MADSKKFGRGMEKEKISNEEKEAPKRKKLKHRKNKAPKARCKRCGAVLFGINMNGRVRSMRRVSRPYSGELCSRCAREEIKSRFRRGG